MIGFLISCAISAAILSFIPMVKHKGFGACFAVAAIMALLNVLLLTVAALPTMLVGLLVFLLPFGSVLMPISVLLISWLINTVSLYFADQAIEDFEIKTIGDTAITALILAIGNTVIRMVIT